MKITESDIQPLLAVIFLMAGGIFYLPKIVLGWIPMRKRLPVSQHLLEGVWGLIFSLAFGAVSHFAYDGRIKYFTLLSYLLGALLSALFLKLPLEKTVRYFVLRQNGKKKQAENEKIKNG